MTVRRILLVDDEADIRTIGEMSLVEVGGYQVTLARSGTEAIACAAAGSYDLILLDVMMPQLDGLATFEQLKARGVCPNTPVIFMTAKVQRQEIAQYLALGAIGIIAKPFDVMRLPHDVARIVESAEARS